MPLSPTPSNIKQLTTKKIQTFLQECINYNQCAFLVVTDNTPLEKILNNRKENEYLFTTKNNVSYLFVTNLNESDITFTINSSKVDGYMVKNVSVWMSKLLQNNTFLEAINVEPSDYDSVILTSAPKLSKIYDNLHNLEHEYLMEKLLLHIHDILLT